MANPSKQKGTRAETNVVRYLNTWNIPAERKALTGSQDHGDIKAHAGTLGEIMIEVKAGKQTLNPSRTQLEEWQRQTMVEAENAACPGILVVVRYRRPIENADCYFKWHGKWCHTFLDELCKMIGEL